MAQTWIFVWSTSIVAVAAAATTHAPGQEHALVSVEYLRPEELRNPRLLVGQALVG